MPHIDHVFKHRVGVENTGHTSPQQLLGVVSSHQGRQGIAPLVENLWIGGGVIKRKMTVRINQPRHHSLAGKVDPPGVLQMSNPAQGLIAHGSNLVALDQDRR
jgi:hypothetical protein